MVYDSLYPLISSLLRHAQGKDWLNSNPQATWKNLSALVFAINNVYKALYIS